MEKLEDTKQCQVERRNNIRPWPTVFVAILIRRRLEWSFPLCSSILQEWQPGSTTTFNGVVGRVTGCLIRIYCIAAGKCCQHWYTTTLHLRIEVDYHASLATCKTQSKLLSSDFARYGAQSPKNRHFFCVHCLQQYQIYPTKFVFVMVLFCCHLFRECSQCGFFSYPRMSGYHQADHMAGDGSSMSSFVLHRLLLLLLG